MVDEAGLGHLLEEAHELGEVAGLGDRGPVGHPEEEGAEAQAVVQEVGELVLQRLRALVGEGRAHCEGPLPHAFLARLDHHREVGDPLLGHAQEGEAGLGIGLSRPAESGRR